MRIAGSYHSGVVAVIQFTGDTRTKTKHVRNEDRMVRDGKAVRCKSCQLLDSVEAGNWSGALSEPQEERGRGGEGGNAVRGFGDVWTHLLALRKLLIRYITPQHNLLSTDVRCAMLRLNMRNFLYSVFDSLKLVITYGEWLFWFTWFNS